MLLSLKSFFRMERMLLSLKSSHNLCVRESMIHTEYNQVFYSRSFVIAGVDTLDDIGVS